MRVTVEKIGDPITKLKWNRAGYIQKRDDDRWSTATTEWWARNSYRNV